MTGKHEGTRLRTRASAQGTAPPRPRQAPGPARRALLAFLALALLLLLALTGPAAAHEIRPTIAHFSVTPDGTLRIELSMNLEAAIAGIGPDHDDTAESPAAPVYDRLRAMPPDALRTEFEAFAPTFIERLRLSFGDRPARLSVADVAIPPVGDTDLPRHSEVVLAAPLPPGAEGLAWQADRSLGAFVLRLRAPDSDEVLGATYVTAGAAAGPLPLGEARPPQWGEVFVNYLEVGFVHIVPRGLDHILFVVGLFLLSTRLGPLLWQVTAFTVAHTVTLALGTLGIVSLSPAIVEPLIALSIAWVGIENLLTDRLHRWRPVVVFGFGLLHGLGFAGVLGEIGLSTTHFVTGLVAFNIGVELGQLAVIALCFLAVGWSMRRPFYRQAVTIPGSAAIATIALYWTAERLALI